jgi:anthranilate phosphoribosyltransferase
MEKGNLSDIQITTKKEATDAFVKVLNNTSNKTMKEITILNAAGGLLVGGICNKFEEGVELALKTINSGDAFKKLKQFAKENNSLDKLEEFE